MAVYQGRNQERKSRKKRKANNGSNPRNTRLDETAEPKNKKISTTGGNEKTILSSTKFANIADGSKVKKAGIKAIDENPANRDFKRMNVITKGAIIETELGKAVVTSRPSQDGTVNAKLL